MADQLVVDNLIAINEQLNQEIYLLKKRVNSSTEDKVRALSEQAQMLAETNMQQRRTIEQLEEKLSRLESRRKALQLSLNLANRRIKEDSGTPQVQWIEPPSGLSFDSTLALSSIVMASIALVVALWI